MVFMEIRTDTEKVKSRVPDSIENRKLSVNYL